MIPNFTCSKLFIICFILAISDGRPNREKCPEVRPMEMFNIFDILGHWYVLQYYSSSEEALTYHCMQVEFELTQSYMDMVMKITYKYAFDPSDEFQKGNITWLIPDPRRPEHWRHTESHYTGVYNTDVIDTDYKTWLLLLHCADPETDESTRFLSTFILSRKPKLDRMQVDYLREKVSQFQVPMEYLFPVKQQRCLPNMDGQDSVEEENLVKNENNDNNNNYENDEELNATVGDLFEENEEANAADSNEDQNQSEEEDRDL